MTKTNLQPGSGSIHVFQFQFHFQFLFKVHSNFSSFIRIASMYTRIFRWFHRVVFLKPFCSIIELWQCSVVSLLQVIHVFYNYGPGVRYVKFKHAAKDVLFWKGHFGTWVTKTSLTVRLKDHVKKWTLDRIVNVSNIIRSLAYHAMQTYVFLSVFMCNYSATTMGKQKALNDFTMGRAIGWVEQRVHQDSLAFPGMETFIENHQWKESTTQAGHDRMQTSATYCDTQQTSHCSPNQWSRHTCFYSSNASNCTHIVSAVCLVSSF